VFGQNKSKVGKHEESELTSLNLCPPPSPQVPTAAPAEPPSAHPAPVQPCLQLALNPQATLAICIDFRRRFDEWMKTGPKPQLVFYLVFPQQGLSLSFSTKDGTKTILLLFGSTWTANAYVAAKGLKAVTAGCRLESLPQQAQKWSAAGINCFTLDPCSRCGNGSIHPISELESEEQFIQIFGLDAVNRKIYGQIIVRSCQTQLTNQKYVRENLERVRDHLDCGNPYVHWVIAVFAGMMGDLVANAAAIDRLEAFGPAFAGKVVRNSFDHKDPKAQIYSMAEALLGLLASYGIVNVPMKPAAN
jgi:hypothetical protein